MFKVLSYSARKVRTGDLLASGTGQASIHKGVGASGWVTGCARKEDTATGIHAVYLRGVEHGAGRAHRSPHDVLVLGLGRGRITCDLLHTHTHTHTARNRT